MMPSQGFGGTGGKRAFISEKQVNKGQILRERGTKTILGNREHKKTNFRFGGGGQANLFQGYIGTGIPKRGPHLYRVGHSIFRSSMSEITKLIRLFSYIMVMPCYVASLLELHGLLFLTFLRRYRTCINSRSISSSSSSNGNFSKQPAMKQYGDLKTCTLWSEYSS